MKYSRLRLLAGTMVSSDLKTSNLSDETVRAFHHQLDPVRQAQLQREHMAEAEAADREAVEKRLDTHGPSLVAVNLSGLSREALAALAVQVATDAHILRRYLATAEAEIAALRADVEAEYALAQALLRERELD